MLDEVYYSCVHCQNDVSILFPFSLIPQNDVTAQLRKNPKTILLDQLSVRPCIEMHSKQHTLRSFYNALNRNYNFIKKIDKKVETKVTTQKLNADGPLQKRVV